MGYTPYAPPGCAVGRMVGGFSGNRRKFPVALNGYRKGYKAHGMGPRRATGGATGGLARETSEIQEGIHGDDALLAGCDTASGAVGAVSGVHVGSEAVDESGSSGQLGSLATGAP